jgi:hypothetical protein
MRHRKRNAIALLVIALILFAFEGGIWARSTIHARSETDKQNIQGSSLAERDSGHRGCFPADCRGGRGRDTAIKRSATAKKHIRAARYCMIGTA